MTKWPQNSQKFTPTKIKTHTVYPYGLVVMITIQEFKICFNVTFTHSTVVDIYIPFWAMSSITVPLNYNFISTRVDTRGNTRYFVCKMPKFPVENIIST